MIVLNFEFFSENVYCYVHFLSTSCYSNKFRVLILVQVVHHVEGALVLLELHQDYRVRDHNRHHLQTHPTQKHI